MVKTSISLLSLIALFLFSCDSGPKVIEPESAATAENVRNMAPVNTSPTSGAAAAEHKVQVEDVLHTEKYTYLDVTENGERFWIAVPRMDIEKGESIAYRGGLLKKNFFSKEYNRVFETLYLVSDIRMPAAGGSAVDEAMSRIQGGNVLTDDSPIQVEPAKGAISLKELLSNKEKYEGKTVMVTGKCVKVNPNIMGRNWIHIQDGSVDNGDLTITTMENIPVGHVITLEGVIALNKDFGAGYRYDIIMEGAVLK